MAAAGNTTFAGDQGATMTGPGSATCPATSPLLVFLATLLTSILQHKNGQRQQQTVSARRPPAEYDYIVVGAGSSGCVMAARLSEDANRTVLLLERGGFEPPEARVPGYTINNLDSAIAQLIKAEPEPHNCNATGCVLNVPSVAGGGSTINGMLYVRGAHRDYDEWARLTGDQGWSARSVLRYFKKAEDNLNPEFTNATSPSAPFHGRGGPQKVSWLPYRHPVMTKLAQGLRELGQSERFDINAQSQLGYSTIQTTAAGGERWSTARSYLEPVLGRGNLHVETFAKAKKVVLDKNQYGLLKASSVEYVSAAGETHVIRARRQVILTAGALHTPQLLMLSGIGPARHLKEVGVASLLDLPVGEGLMDHPDIAGIEYACEPPLCVTDWRSRQEDLREYNATRTGPLSAVNVLHFMSFSRSRLASPWSGNQPDLQLLFLGKTVTKEETCLPFDSWRLNRAAILVSLMRPESEGSVRLNASDLHGPPVVKLNYLGDARGHDLAVAVEGLKLALRLEQPLAKLGLRLVRDANPQCASSGAFGSDAYLRCVARTRTQTAWHWSGTARMGRGGRGVLDARLRVRGTAGLRVCDASAMPYIPSGNTNAATIMLAERCADLVRQEDRQHGQYGYGQG